GKSLTTYNLLLFFLLLFQLVFPSTMPVFILTIIFLALAGGKEIKEVKPGNSVYIFAFPLTIFILIALFFTGNWTLAEINYRLSISALSANKGTDAYNLQKNAIYYNPRLDRYHVALSQTSLALANALSAKKELTADDRQNIPKLIQQSIEEARLAVELNKTSIINWDNLAKIYSSLVNFAAGSDKWAIDADEQKIKLDPQNPNHRIALGNLLFNLKRYDEAQVQYSEAVSLKSDLPIARYQLAQTFKEQKKYAQSRQELQETLSLLEVNSPDAQKVQKELEELPNF
ncbi:tetratricopeptide repeat protein, partial [Candidatus Microgenomates bacterium]|nr:tetratricopeptide repeat protein [Candidatus Microgenomates bacterium]